MIYRSVRRSLSRLYWGYRNQVCRRTWSFFVWERRSPLPQLAQEHTVLLAGKGDEIIGERMAVLRGASVEQYRGWLTAGNWVLYAVGPDNDIRSWMWFTVAKDRSEVAPFDFGIGMKVPPGIAFLWDAFTVPAHRRRGLYKALLVQSVEECLVQGAGQVWGHAQITNPSRSVIRTTDLSGETTIYATRLGPFCRVSRPGFHRTISVRGVLDMDALLSIETKAEQPAA